MDVKYQDEKIESLRHQVESLKDENKKLDNRLGTAQEEAIQLASFLKKLTNSLLQGKNHQHDKYAILNKCTQYSLLSNAMTEDLLKCEDLGFVWNKLSILHIKHAVPRSEELFANFGWSTSTWSLIEFQSVPLKVNLNLKILACT